MFSGVVFFEDMGGDLRGRRVEGEREKCELGNGFEGDRIIDGLLGGLPPRKGAVVAAKDTGNGDWIEVVRLKGFQNNGSGICLVVIGGFVGCQCAGARDGTVEVVGVRCSETGKVASGLCPCGCVGTVRMDDAGEFRECPVEGEVGFGIGRRAKGAGERSSVLEADNCHFIGGEGFDGNAGRFDEHQSAFTVENGDIAPCQDDQSGLMKTDICLVGDFLGGFLHGGEDGKWG